VKEIKGRKVIVETTLSANGRICARGEVIAVQLPEHLLPESAWCSVNTKWAAGWLCRQRSWRILGSDSENGCTTHNLDLLQVIRLKALSLPPHRIWPL